MAGNQARIGALWTLSDKMERGKGNYNLFRSKKKALPAFKTAEIRLNE